MTGFSSDNWKDLAETWDAWFCGELKRPLMTVSFKGRDPERPEPPLPAKWFTSSYSPDVSASAIVDRWDWDISQQVFAGDAFPAVFPNFGPGIIAGFIGAHVETAEDTVWFGPAQPAEIMNLQFTSDPGNLWLRRVSDIMHEAASRWGGRVQVGMTDLGGSLDILASFRPGEQLLLDLYDHPQQVEKLLWQTHELWFHYFGLLDGLVRGSNPGYSCWAPIFSPQPYYMLQCDFSYMISPDMFRQFVAPELRASCQKLTNAFYHLDGPGEIPHLDILLEIPELKGIQWIPGAGAPEIDQWPDLLRKIREAGKLIQVYSTPAQADNIIKQLGTGEGVLFALSGLRTSHEALEYLSQYNDRLQLFDE